MHIFKNGLSWKSVAEYQVPYGGWMQTGINGADFTKQHVFQVLCEYESPCGATIAESKLNQNFQQIPKEEKMNQETKIGIDIFKAVTKSIAHSEDIEVMSNHFAQLIVAALDIKGCAIFILNPKDQELEIMASFGLSIKYLTKGPLKAPKSIHDTFKGKSVIIPDISKDDQLQYPDEAQKEGIAAIVSLPVLFAGEVIGVLRLYHYQPWNISEADLDSLNLLADNIGLAITFARYRNAIHAVSEIIGNVFNLELPEHMAVR